MDASNVAPYVGIFFAAVLLGILFAARKRQLRKRRYYAEQQRQQHQNYDDVDLANQRWYIATVNQNPPATTSVPIQTTASRRPSVDSQLPVYAPPRSPPRSHSRQGGTNTLGSGDQQLPPPPPYQREDPEHVTKPPSVVIRP